VLAAEPGEAEVTVRYADHYLRVEVLNSGPSVLSGNRAAPAAGHGLRGEERGLLGLRERVADLDARKRLGGGFRAGTTVTDKPRVDIADDQALVRIGFRMILTAGGIDVVGEAADGTEAVTAVRDLKPDVVLMDIRMPNMDGLEATRRILAKAPKFRVLMLTTFDLDRYVYTALAAGASGFLLKDVTPEHLVAAVRLVDTGDALLAPSITRRLVERFASSGVEPPSPATPFPRRPDTEGTGSIDADGPRPLQRRTHAQRADGQTHVAHIFAKLALRDRAQAVVLAYETGLVSPGDAGER
jgi:DNA-binding NarL/FixJ family response regulator